MTLERSLFEPDDGPAALFLDTSALVPLFTTAAGQHEEVTAFFDAVADDELAYQPLYTNQYVLDEMVTLLLSRATPRTAADALDAVEESVAIQVLSVGDDEFDRAVAAFHEYADQSFSLTDHLVAIQAGDRDVSHVLSYDDDFRALDLTVIPRR